MRRVRLTHPIVLGIFASVGLAAFVVVSAIGWGFHPVEILIAIGTIGAGSATGIYLTWKLTKGIREGR